MLLKELFVDGGLQLSISERVRKLVGMFPQTQYIGRAIISMIQSILE